MSDSLFPEGPKGPLLKAALEVAVQGWPASFTMAEIARQAGTSKPRLAYHFSNTEEILLALVEIWGRSGQQVTEAHLATLIGAPPVELIHGIVDATFLWKRKHPLFAAFSSCLILLAQSHNEFAQIQKEVMEQGWKRMLFLLENDPELKEVSSSKRKDLARGIHLTLVGGFLYFLATAGLESERKLIDKIKSSIAGQIQAARSLQS